MFWLLFIAIIQITCKCLILLFSYVFFLFAVYLLDLLQNAFFRTKFNRRSRRDSIQRQVNDGVSSTGRRANKNRNPSITSVIMRPTFERSMMTMSFLMFGVFVIRVVQVYIYLFFETRLILYIRKNVRKSHYDREKSSFFFTIIRTILIVMFCICVETRANATTTRRHHSFFTRNVVGHILKKKKNFLSCCTPAKSVPLTVVWWPNRDKDKSYASLRRIFFFFFYDNYVQRMNVSI